MFGDDDVHLKEGRRRGGGIIGGAAAGGESRHGKLCSQMQAHTVLGHLWKFSFIQELDLSHYVYMSLKKRLSPQSHCNWTTKVHVNMLVRLILMLSISD